MKILLKWVPGMNFRVKKEDLGVRNKITKKFTRASQFKEI